MDFVTDLHLPHSEGRSAVPNVWIDDAPHSAGAEAFGFLVTVLTFVRPGQVTSLAEIELTRQHPDDSPVADLVARLVDAGYLRDDGAEQYALVHPERLGPLPQ